MMQDSTTRYSKHESAETIPFSIVCGASSISQGYVDYLDQQGFSHDLNATLVLLLDVPRGIALQRLEAVGTATHHVVVITWSTCAEYWEDLWDLRPHILIIGDGLPADVAQALRDAERGLRYRGILDYPVTLLPSERRILRLVAQGLPNREIAARLSTSLQTVKNSLTTLYHKLHLSDRSQAILYYWGIWQDTENDQSLVKSSTYD